MRAHRITLLALLAVFSAGCLGSLLPSAEDRAVYALPEAAPMQAATSWNAALHLAPVQALAPRDGSDVLVLRADGEFQLLPGVRWAAPLPALMQELLARQIERSGLASAVAQGSADLAAPLRAHADLLAFELREQAGGLQATASLGLRLVCTRDGRLLAASEPITVESSAVPNRPAQATAALREAAALLARQAVFWLAKVDWSACRA